MNTYENPTTILTVQYRQHNHSYRINMTIRAWHIYLFKWDVDNVLHIYVFTCTFIPCNFMHFFIVEGCAGRSQLWARINPKPVHLEFVVEQVTVWKVLVWVPSFPLVSIVLPMLHIHTLFICHQHCIIIATDVFVQCDTFFLNMNC